MNQTFFELPKRPVTVVISDLHIGGGTNDPGDDHIDHGKPLIRFFNELPKSVNAQATEILLVINGDFLEFVQTAPELFDSDVAYGNWCCENESLDKVNVIIEGNKDIWKAMKGFQQLGGHIVIAVGNHDIDFTWPKVRDVFTQAAGYDTFKFAKDSEEPITCSKSLDYVLGKDWLTGYEGKLLITHGNQYDPANKFSNWHDPIQYGYGPDRLEMCAGTMFMIKFVNQMEKEYPFVDNIIPITRLYNIMRKSKKEKVRDDWKAMHWLLGIFIARHPIHSIGTPGSGGDDYSLDKMFKLYRIDDTFKRNVDEAVNEALKKAQNWVLPKNWNENYDAFNNVVIKLFALMPIEQWLKLFNLSDRGTLGGIAPSAIAKDKEELRNQAKRAMINHDAQVVVMGHTHQPDELNFDYGQYFNPGSWTRYWNISQKPEIEFEELKNESLFPYQLNFIEIRRDTNGSVRGFKRVFESSKTDLTNI